MAWATSSCLGLSVCGNPRYYGASWSGDVVNVPVTPIQRLTFSRHDVATCLLACSSAPCSINSRVGPLTPKIRNLRIPECCLRQQAIHIQPLTDGISNALFSPMNLKSLESPMVNE